MGPNQEPKWQPDEALQQEGPQTPVASPSVEWQASEYIHHDKGPLWYIVLIVVALAAVGLSIWLQAWTFVALVVVMAVAVGVYAARTPRPFHYALGPDGLQINDRHYSYDQFHSFGVVPDGALFSIILMPTKRFMPSLTIYFPQEEGEKIVDILGSKLPMEELKHDLVERLTKRLHF